MKSKIVVILLLGLVGLCSAQTVYLYTPNGSQVQAVSRSELSPGDIAYFNNQCASQYPNAEILAPASQTYNCHSYAWNLSSGGSTICWLNQSPGLNLYWNDGSYTQTTESNAVKIFYYDGDHSAVKSATNTGMYESKWGAWPLVRHAPGYGPYTNMQNRRYYLLNCPKPATNFFNRNVTTYTEVRNNCNDINVQNVIVRNGAKLLLNASRNVNINSTFEVELGSSFEVIKP